MKLQTWANTYVNEKKYLISNNYNLASNFIRKQDTLINNVEVRTLIDLAKDIIRRENAKKGSIKDIRIISQSLTLIYLSNILRKKETFIPKESICDGTIIELFNKMNTIRSSKKIKDDERLQKIDEIKEEYLNLLEKNGYIDEIIAYQQAIDILNSSSEVINNKVAILDVYNNKLSYIEKTFIDAYAKHLAKPLDIIELSSDNVSNNYEFYSSYGDYNEVDNVISDIITKKYDFSDCEILLSTSKLETLIRNNLDSREIDYAYISNYSIANKDIISFVKTTLDFALSDFDYQYFLKLIRNKGINLDIPYISYTDDKEKGRCEYLSQLGIDAGIYYTKERYEDFIYQITNNQLAYFTCLSSVNKNIDIDHIDNEVLTKFVDFIRSLMNVFDGSSDLKPGLLLENILMIYKPFIKEDSDNKLFDSLYTISLLLNELDDTESLKESAIIIEKKIEKQGAIDNNNPKKLIVHSMTGETVFERKHLYVLGLDYDSFEPALKDSSIISDNVLKECFDNDYYIDFSLAKSKEKREILLNSLQTFDGEMVKFYMSNYDTSAFRENIASPIYNELRQTKNIIKCEAKYQNITKINTNQIIKLDVDYASQDFVYKDGATGVYKLKKPLSATHLNKIMKCPLQYIYYTKYLKTEYEARNPYEWLNPLERGNLLHLVFENYCKELIGVKSCDLSSVVDIDRFNQIYNDAVQVYKNLIPYPSEIVFKLEEEKYREDAYNYLSMMHQEFKEKSIHIIKVESECENTKDKVLYVDSEGNNVPPGTAGALEISFKHDTRIDREDIFEKSGEIRIVDYKTKNSKFDDDDLNINLQWFVYSYLEGADYFAYHFPCASNASDIFANPIKEQFDALPKGVGKRLYEFFVKGEVLSLIDEKVAECEYCDHKGICVKKLRIDIKKEGQR